MFNVGETVICRGSGLCEVIDRGPRKIVGKPKDYYVLRPVDDNGNNKIYIPADNAENLLTKPMTPAEIDRMIAETGSGNVSWIENDKDRQKYFSSVTNSDDYPEILMLIRAVMLQKREKAGTGARLRQSDDKFLKENRQRIENEFSYALGVTPGEVADRLEKAFL